MLLEANMEFERAFRFGAANGLQNIVEYLREVQEIILLPVQINYSLRIGPANVKYYHCNDLKKLMKYQKNCHIKAVKEGKAEREYDGCTIEEFLSATKIMLKNIKEDRKVIIRHAQLRLKGNHGKIAYKRKI